MNAIVSDSVMPHQGARTMCRRLSADINSSQVCATSLQLLYSSKAFWYMSACTRLSAVTDSSMNIPLCIPHALKASSESNSIPKSAKNCVSTRRAILWAGVKKTSSFSRRQCSLFVEIGRIFRPQAAKETVPCMESKCTWISSSLSTTC